MTDIKQLKNMNRQLTVQEEILQTAFNYIGLKEIVGEEDNPVIVQMFKKIGHSWVKDDETAWCSCFINYVALQCGLQRSLKLNAKSWLITGEVATNPVPGDVVVFWRGKTPADWQGHVGIFMGFAENGNIFCLGGNQGNEVNITEYPKKKLLAFRRLNKI